MPTYDYVCRACGHDFELFQQITAPVKRKCPECGALKLERLIGTGAGVIFKGSGFYETDYRSDSYRKGADAEKSKASDSSSSGSESKTADTKSSDTKKKKEKSDTASKKKSSKDASST